MRVVVDLLSPRSFARAFALLAVGLVAANCSPDAVRFNDNPFATSTRRPPAETTGSVPRGHVEARPLAEPQPEGQPSLPASSRAPPTQPSKRVSEHPPGKIEEPQAQPPPAALPAHAARRPKTWLPAPPEGMRSVPPDFLMGGEK